MYIYRLIVFLASYSLVSELVGFNVPINTL